MHNVQWATSGIQVNPGSGLITSTAFSGTCRQKKKRFEVFLQICVFVNGRCLLSRVEWCPVKDSTFSKIASCPSMKKFCLKKSSAALILPRLPLVSKIREFCHHMSSFGRLLYPWVTRHDKEIAWKFCRAKSLDIWLLLNREHTNMYAVIAPKPCLRFVPRCHFGFCQRLDSPPFLPLKYVSYLFASFLETLELISRICLSLTLSLSLASLSLTSPWKYNNEDVIGESVRACRDLNYHFWAGRTL